MAGKTVASAVSNFGASAKAKLSNVAISGAPEDQLRGPLDTLLHDLAEIGGLPPKAINLVGETTLKHLKTRPDYAVTVSNALVGFIEVKAPGKGADPRKFSDPHDKDQWDKLKSLPNLLYTDGNAFSLWRDGELIGKIVHLDGDIETSGAKLAAPTTLAPVVDDFLQWTPIPPKTAKKLAEVCARLCRLLRDEVVEQMGLGNPGLTALAQDWRKLLFPQADDAQFADGYAQAVTFGLLVARSRDISLSAGIYHAAQELRKSNSLIATALKLLTDDVTNQEALKTSLSTLTRVLDEVNWHTISKDKPEAWLYFYEEFLEVYDNKLRKRTGSYYTPPEVVSAMVNLVDEALRGPLFDRATGLAAADVVVADPAVGTGTFLLGVLRQIALTVAEDVVAYFAAVMAHPGFTARFQSDLVQPGLRVPMTADAKLFTEAVALGSEVIWLHCYGERIVEPAANRPKQPPRLPKEAGPTISAGGKIPSAPEPLPDTMNYDPAARRLMIGKGYIENVAPEMWAYEVSGKRVIWHWFSYRRGDRSRPIMGDRRPPSPLDNIQPEGWLPEYTTDLLDLLHVLGRLIALEPKQADLLDRICAGPLRSAEELDAAGALAMPEVGSPKPKGKSKS